MAKDNDDFDLDDFDDLDFGDEPPSGASSGDRNPVLETAKQAKKSIMNTVLPRARRNEIILEGLPNDASVVYDNVRDLEYAASDVLTHTKEELVKTQRRLKQQTRQLVPTLKKYLPDSIVDPINRWSKPEEFSSSQHYDPNQAMMDRGMAEVFGGDTAQNQDLAKKATEQRIEVDVQNKIRQTIEDIKTDNLHQIVTGIANDVSGISTFTRGINVSFQKKLLELNYRQMFALQDMLAVNKAAFDRTAPALEAIVKNTALPDYAKENFGEVQSAELKRTVAGWISPTKYLDSFVSNFQTRLKEKITSTFSQGSSLLGDVLGMGVEEEDIFDNDGFSGPDNRKDNLKNKGMDLAFSALAKKLINPKRDQFLEWTREKLSENPVIAEQLAKARYYTSNIGSVASSSLYGDREGFVGDFFKVAQEFGLIDRMSKEQIELGARDAKMLQTASKFDNRTYLTLNEVIPAELREIRRAITRGYGVDDDRVYDITARGFVSEKQIGNRVRKYVGNDEHRAAQRKKVDQIIDMFGKDNFNSAERAKIAKFIETRAATGREFNIKHFIDNPDKVYGSLGYDLGQKFVSALEGETESGDTAYQFTNKIGEEFASLRRGIGSYQARVNEMQSIYGDRALMSSRLFKYDPVIDKIIGDDNIHDLYRDVGDVSSSTLLDTKQKERYNRIAEHLHKGSATAAFLQRYKNLENPSILEKDDLSPKFVSGGMGTSNFNFPVLSSILYGDEKTNFVELFAAQKGNEVDFQPVSSELSKVVDAIKGASVKEEVAKMLEHLRSMDEDGVLIAKLTSGKSSERESKDKKKKGKGKRQVIDLGFEKGLLSRWFGVFGDTASKGWDVTKGVFGGIKNTAGKIAGKMNIPEGWLKDKILGIPGFLKDGAVSGFRGVTAFGKAVIGARDIYDASGERVLDGAKLKEGQYYVKDGDTLRAIYGIEEISGEIYDKDGNVVLSAERLAKAGTLTFYKDSRWWKLSEVIGGGLGNLINKGLKLPKSAAVTGLEKLKAAGKWFVSFPDMYIAGETTPRIYSRILSAGGYRLTSTGKIIQRPEDITGQVETVDGGHVVISDEDIKRPGFKLVTKWGNEVKTPLGRIAGRFAKTAAWSLKQLGKIPAGLMKLNQKFRESGPVQWAKNKFKDNFVTRWWNKEDDGQGNGWFRFNFANNVFGGNGHKTNDILINIYRLLNRRLPGEQEPEDWLDEAVHNAGRGVKGTVKDFVKRNRRRHEARKRWRRMHGKKSFSENIADRFNAFKSDDGLFGKNLNRFRNSSALRTKEALAKLYGRDDEVAKYIKERLAGNLKSKVTTPYSGTVKGKLFDFFQKASEKEAEFGQFASDKSRRARVNARLAKRKAGKRIKSTREYLAEILRNSEMSWFNQMRRDAESGEMPEGRFRSMLGKFEKRVRFGKNGEKRDYFKWFKSKRAKKGEVGKEEEKGSFFDRFKPKSAFGRFMLSAVGMLGKAIVGTAGLLLKGFGTLAGGALKMAAKGLILPVAKGAYGLAAAAGSAIVAAVGWPAIAVVATGAAVGWGVYKLATRKRAYYLDKLRLAQYGVHDYHLWSSDDGAKSRYLEEFLTGYTTFDGNGGAVLRGLNATEVEKVAEGYGLDPKDQTQMLSFHAYMQQRFIPIYLSWMSGIRKAESSPKLADLGSTNKVSKEDMLTIFNAVKRTADDPAFKALTDPRQTNRGMFKRAWDYVTFTDIGFLPGEEVAEVTKEVEKEIRARREPRRKQKKPDVITVESVNDTFKDIRQVDGANIALNDPSAENKVDGFTGAATKLDYFSPFVEKAAVDIKDIDALQSLRFKAYGLMRLDNADVKRLIAFEDAVLPNMNRQTGAYEGDLKAALGVLGISEDHPKYKTARIWFRYRFLPVYATYVIACKRYVPNANPNRLVNSGSYIYEIALLIERALSERGGVKVSIWSVLETPFEGSANTDSSSVKEELLTLEKLSKKDDMTVRNILKANEIANKPIFLRKKDRSSGMFEITADKYSGAPTKLPDTFKPSNPNWGNMNMSPGSFETNTMVKAGNYATIRDLGGDIPSIIKEAAAVTGISPSLLLTVAQMESSLNPNARPKTKTGYGNAAGLFQFMPSTWEEMLRKHGNRYGIPANASPFDPVASAILGAEYLKEGAKVSKSMLDKELSAADYYMPHFLGPGDVKKFYKGLRENPNGIAAEVLPKPARSNPRIFFDNQGRPRTFSEVYRAIHQKIASSESYIRKYVGGGAKTNVSSMFDNLPSAERRNNAIDFKASSDAQSIVKASQAAATPLPDGTMPTVSSDKAAKRVSTAADSFANDYPSVTPEEKERYKETATRNVETQNNVIDLNALIEAGNTNTENIVDVLQKSYTIQEATLVEIRAILRVLLERSDITDKEGELRKLDDRTSAKPANTLNVGHGQKMISTARVRNL